MIQQENWHWGEKMEIKIWWKDWYKKVFNRDFSCIVAENSRTTVVNINNKRQWESAVGIGASVLWKMIVLYSPVEPWLCSVSPTSAFLRALALCASWTSWSSPVSGRWHRTSPLLPRHLSEQTRHTKASQINTKIPKHLNTENLFASVFHDIQKIKSLNRDFTHNYLTIEENRHTSRQKSQFAQKHIKAEIHKQ